ncbi:MAG: hypothetical protein DCC65_01080 [Planctomycetota bacterium]|nr:MAG: hypothetical protein DCC65_01080 [Planctomycetota bacterium]
MIFNFEWWFDTSYRERLDEARHRCAAGHFPDIDPAKAMEDAAYKAFYDQLESRTIVYLRDGFSYEIRELIPSRSTSALTFECTPADDAYKVGAFVVTVPFEDIIRVEVFSYHPKEKPEDMPSIKGFSSAQVPPPPAKRIDDRPARREAQE